MSKFLKLIRNEEGATSIEYGLIAALIAVAAIVAMVLANRSFSASVRSVIGHHNRAFRYVLAFIVVATALIPAWPFQASELQRRVELRGLEPPDPTLPGIAWPGFDGWTVRPDA